MARIRPIGHGKMWWLVWNDQMDGDDWDMQTNSRQANCKVCGTDIPKGTGAYWRRYGPNNDFRFTRNYLCVDCQAIWGDLKYRKIKDRFGILGKTLVPASWDKDDIKNYLNWELIESRMRSKGDWVRVTNADVDGIGRIVKTDFADDPKMYRVLMEYYYRGGFPGILLKRNRSRRRIIARESEMRDLMARERNLRDSIVEIKETQGAKHRKTKR